MKPDPCIEERERLADRLERARHMLDSVRQFRTEDEYVTDRINESVAEIDAVSAALRAPTRAPEEGRTAIEGFVTQEMAGSLGRRWVFSVDATFGLQRATLILHASVTVDGEVTE